MAFGDSRPRNYWKTSADFKKGDKITFVTGGEWVERDFSEGRDGSDMKHVFSAQGKLNDGETKELTINSTSGSSLGESWGEEGPAWVGKIANVSFVKMPVFGKMKDVLMLVPTDEKAAEEPKSKDGVGWEEEEN